MKCLDAHDDNIYAYVVDEMIKIPMASSILSPTCRSREYS